MCQINALGAGGHKAKPRLLFPLTGTRTSGGQTRLLALGAGSAQQLVD